MDENIEKEEKKEIEIIQGNVNELDLSPVYKHLNVAKPTPKDEKKKNIIIPEIKKNKE